VPDPPLVRGGSECAKSLPIAAEMVSAVLIACFAMAFEGVVIDTDHWRHFYLIMAMVWGLALAGRTQAHPARR
jgi:hypothetical protein